MAVRPHVREVNSSTASTSRCPPAPPPARFTGASRRFVERLFPQGAPPVVLAVPGYDPGEDAARVGLQEYDERAAGEHRPESPWAAESPKRYLAAQIAVGTVDQAMMAALKVGHSHITGRLPGPQPAGDRRGARIGHLHGPASSRRCSTPTRARAATRCSCPPRSARGGASGGGSPRARARRTDAPPFDEALRRAVPRRRRPADPRLRTPARRRRTSGARASRAVRAPRDGRLPGRGGDGARRRAARGEGACGAQHRRPRRRHAAGAGGGGPGQGIPLCCSVSTASGRRTTGGSQPRTAHCSTARSRRCWARSAPDGRRGRRGHADAGAVAGHRRRPADNRPLPRGRAATAHRQGAPPRPRRPARRLRRARLRGADAGRGTTPYPVRGRLPQPVRGKLCRRCWPAARAPTAWGRAAASTRTCACWRPRCAWCAAAASGASPI